MLAAGITTAAAADLAYPAPPPAALPALPSFYIHAGPAGLFYAEKARISVAGAVVPGASVTINDAPTFAVEAGYYITRNIAASVTVGFPPLSKFNGAGTFDGLGLLGKARGGPSGVSIHYHFVDLGPFQPYVGAGIALLTIFDSQDALMTNLKVDHAAGFLLQGGFDYMINERWGVFLDVKKTFVKTNATGVFGGAPVSARVTLDPVVVHTGITFRF